MHARVPFSTLRTSMWRQRLALGLIVLWAVIGTARLSRVLEAPESPPGASLVPLVPFLRDTIPPTAGYLYVLPTRFGEDTGDGPRLRYELYPRTYDDIRFDVDETSVRSLMQREHLTYIVVPDATRYSPTHWLRMVPSWLRRIDFDADSYVLEAAP